MNVNDIKHNKRAKNHCIQQQRLSHQKKKQNVQHENENRREKHVRSVKKESQTMGVCNECVYSETLRGIT